MVEDRIQNGKNDADRHPVSKTQMTEYNDYLLRAIWIYAYPDLIRRNESVV